ncbi:MAG TPA: hypothetical protein VFQ05_06585 [Candidatus Eisenbacteria bacterium]|nr:hypothetical protein [Candidatus Eisenbacteria bacterium]
MSRKPAAGKAPTRVVGALPEASPSIHALAASNSELETAVRVARTLLADYGDSSRDGFSYPEAFGATREALRLLLRALGVEDGKGTQIVSTPGGDLPRCPATHPEDPTPCGGPVVVTVLDSTNAGAHGCEHHATRLLASLDGGRVYPLPDAPESAALRVFHAADRTRPFPWMNVPRTRPEQLSRAENRCGRCRQPFDSTDVRHDGHARYAATPFCRRCIDNCRDGSAEHVCVICDPARYGGEGQ